MAKLITLLFLALSLQGDVKLSTAARIGYLVPTEQVREIPRYVDDYSMSDPVYLVAKGTGSPYGYFNPDRPQRTSYQRLQSSRPSRIRPQDFDDIWAMLPPQKPHKPHKPSVNNVTPTMYVHSDGSTTIVYDYSQQPATYTPPRPTAQPPRPWSKPQSSYYFSSSTTSPPPPRPSWSPFGNLSALQSFQQNINSPSPPQTSYEDQSFVEDPQSSLYTDNQVQGSDQSSGPADFYAYPVLNYPGPPTIQQINSQIGPPPGVSEPSSEFETYSIYNVNQNSKPPKYYSPPAGFVMPTGPSMAPISSDYIVFEHDGTVTTVPVSTLPPPPAGYPDIGHPSQTHYSRPWNTPFDFNNKYNNNNVVFY